MSTTVIEPISPSRQSDLTRTRYWEQRSTDAEGNRRYGAGGNTRVGLGPDDPLVQAVQAAKRHLVQATQGLGDETRAEKPQPVMADRASHERVRATLPPVDPSASAQLPAAARNAPTRPQQNVDMSSAKTLLLPALEALQLMAAHVTHSTEPPTAAAVTHVDREASAPAKRRPKRSLLMATALGAVVCIAAVSALTRHEVPTLVRPRPAASASPEQMADQRQPAPAAHASSALDNAPVHAATERAAVDALFAGDYPLAARHYAALAQSQPQQTAFSEAARILQQRAAAEAPQ